MASVMHNIIHQHHSVTITTVTLQNGWSALFFVATKGYLSLVKMLADYGTIVDLKDEVCLIL